MICIKINQNKNHFVSRSIGSKEWYWKISDLVLKDFTKNHVPNQGSWKRPLDDYLNCMCKAALEALRK